MEKEHFNQLLENERIFKFNEEALKVKLNNTVLLENETTTMHQVDYQFTDTHVVVSILLDIDSLSHYNTIHTNTVSSQVTILVALKGHFLLLLSPTSIPTVNVKWASRVLGFLCFRPLAQIRVLNIYCDGFFLFYNYYCYFFFLT